MVPRPAAIPIVLLLLVAGCLGGTSPPPPGPPLPGGPNAFTYRSDCSIANGNQSCAARASSNDAPSKAEIDIAANPTDPLNVFVASKDLDRSASNCVWSVGQVTTDGGHNWTTVYVGGTAQDRASPSHPLFGWACVTDPIMAFDAGGALYYPLQAYNLQSDGPNCTLADSPIGGVPVVGGLVGGCGSAFFLAVSTDGGVTFPTDRIIPMAIAEGTVIFHDYPRMAVSPTTGTVSTVWNAITQVPPGAVNPYVVSTRDQGRSAEGPVIAAPPEQLGRTVFSSGYTAGPDGAFYMTVSFFDPTGGGDSTVYLATSTDDAKSFHGFAPMFPVTPIACPLPNSQFRCGTSIELAADTSTGDQSGRIYATWDDGRNGNADVFVSWSDDQGGSWSEGVQVSENATGHAQWMARSVVAGDGSLHVLLMDRQYDPGDRLYDLTHAWSADGVNWTSTRLTSVSSDGDLGVHQGGFPFIGDYNGIAASGNHIWMGFPTTETGKAEVTVAHAVRDPPGNATAPGGP